MSSYKKDYNTGIQSEQNNQKVIENFIGCPLIKDPNRYAIFDFFNESKTIYVEMKTRNINHNTYATAMIGYNKVEFCKDSTTTYYFIFVYKDGIYYIRYDKSLFETLETGYFKRYDRIDYTDTESKIIYIPYELLKKIDI